LSNLNVADSKDFSRLLKTVLKCSLKPDRSPGCGDFSPKGFLAFNYIERPVADLFNLSMSRSVFQSKTKIVNVDLRLVFELSEKKPLNNNHCCKKSIGLLYSRVLRFPDSAMDKK
jgi:hypothetical protein